MLFPAQWWIILLVALVLNSVGFRKYVWFMTIGYGLTIGGISLCLIVMSITHKVFNGWYLVICLLLMLYAFRLACVLVLREMRSTPENRRVLGNAEKHISMTGLATMWILDSLTFFAMMSPVFYRLANGKTRENGADTVFGILFIIAGIALEVVAEVQKYRLRRATPGALPTKGIYKFTRCPDYFGEIVVWTGVVITGIKTTTGAQWIVVILGYVAVLHMMANGAKRIEQQQLKFYAKNPEYLAYLNSTPILVPFVPIYHLNKVK